MRGITAGMVLLLAACGQTVEGDVATQAQGVEGPACAAARDAAAACERDAQPACDAKIAADRACFQDYWAACEGPDSPCGRNGSPHCRDGSEACEAARARCALTHGERLACDAGCGQLQATARKECGEVPDCDDATADLRQCRSWREPACQALRGAYADCLLEADDMCYGPGSACDGEPVCFNDGRACWAARFACDGVLEELARCGDGCEAEQAAADFACERSACDAAWDRVRQCELLEAPRLCGGDPFGPQPRGSSGRCVAALEPACRDMYARGACDPECPGDAACTDAVATCSRFSTVETDCWSAFCARHVYEARRICGD